MKPAITAIFLFLSLGVFGQDINFKLSGAVKRKWVGESLFLENTTENYTNITFLSNHKAIEYNRKYNAAKPAQTWDIVKGTYLNDDQIILQIGKRQYLVTFSKTNNGKDFMTLSSGGEGDGGEYIIQTFYAE